jgi:hypothetical protein
VRLHSQDCSNWLCNLSLAKRAAPAAGDCRALSAAVTAELQAGPRLVQLGVVSCKRSVVARPLRLLFVGFVAAIAMDLAACASRDERLESHQRKLDSLASTTATIGEAWLGGSVSATYTRTALEQTFQLVEQERAAIVRSPDVLADPRAAHLSELSERFSRVLGLMTHDLAARDRAALRRHLAEIAAYTLPRT